ncbi:MAG TPA: EamA family transporter [Ardenticatenaceae bacterium]|nr:EamA family transporter [Ardenticatenaceae bacterium]
MIDQSYGLLLLSVAIGVVGQLLLKQGMSRRPGFRLRELAALAWDPAIVGGFGCYGVSTLLYLQALARLDLSLAYPTLSLGYVLVIVLSKVLFREPMSRIRWVAVVMICAGVALVGLGAI